MSARGNGSDAPFVICIGEAMIELSVDAATPNTAQIGVAGDTLNTAIYLKRCLPEARVAYATKVGQSDAQSERILSALHDEQLDTRLVLRSPERIPGLYAISTDAAGERDFTYWRATSAARDLLQPPGLTLEMLCPADLVYLSAITLAILRPEDRARLIGLLSRYQAQGGRIAFDSNYRPRLWPDVQTARAAISTAWGLCDIALPSFDDEQALFGLEDQEDILARLRVAGAKTGALKRGAAGPISLAGQTIGRLTTAARVIDTTAAGDSFNGAYLAAHLSGASDAACMTAGHALAATVIGHRGAIIPAEAMP